MQFPLPYDYLIPAYGLYGPIVDGLLIARQICEHVIPDFTWDTGDSDKDAAEGRRHNEYKDKVLADIDRRIEEVKRHV